MGIEVKIWPDGYREKHRYSRPASSTDVSIPELIKTYTVRAEVVLRTMETGVTDDQIETVKAKLVKVLTTQCEKIGVKV